MRRRTSGAILGTLNDTGTLNISGSNYKEIAGVINQAGPTTWAGIQ